MRGLLLLAFAVSVAAEPQLAWVAANFVGDAPPRLTRSREGMLRWTGLWGTRRLQHASLVSRVAVSPDGLWLASASWDGTVKLWEAKTGREIRTLDMGQWVLGLAISPDGRRIYASDAGGEIRIWDSASGATLKSWQLHTELWGLRLSPDGRLLTYFGNDGFGLVDAFALEFSNVEWAAPWKEAVHDALFTPDGAQVVTCGNDNLIRVWDVASRAMATLVGPEVEEPRLCCIAVDPRGLEVAASWSGSTIHRWKLKGGEVAPLRGDEGDQFTSIGYSPDGGHIASTGGDDLQLWVRATGVCARTWRAHDDSASAVSFAPDGSWLVSGGEDGTVRIWDLATGKERLGDERLPHAVDHLAVSEDGTWAVAALWTEARLWDAATGAIRRRVVREEYTLAVATTPDGRVISTWGDEKEVERRRFGWRSGVTVWDPATGEDLLVPDGQLGWGSAVAVEPSGKWAVATSWDRVALAWTLDTGRLVRTLRSDTGLDAVAVSPDGLRIAAVGRPFDLMDPAWRIYVWGPEAERPLFEIRHAREVRGISFSPDGARLAAASKDATVRLWATKDGAEAGVLRGHPSAVTAVAWSDDGRWIFSGGEDAFVRVWDVATGTEADLLPVDGGPEVLVFRKGRIYVGCANRTVCVYEWKPPE